MAKEQKQNRTSPRKGKGVSDQEKAQPLPSGKEEHKKTIGSPSRECQLDQKEQQLGSKTPSKKLQIKVQCFKCSVCSQQFFDVVSSLEHMKTHKKASQETPKHSLSLSQYGNTTDDTKSKTKTKVPSAFKCSVCHQQFSDYGSCFAHVNSHQSKTKESTKQESQQSNVTDDNKNKHKDKVQGFKCSVCLLNFADYESCISHVNTHKNSNDSTNEASSITSQQADTSTPSQTKGDVVEKAVRLSVTNLQKMTVSDNQISSKEKSTSDTSSDVKTGQRRIIMLSKSCKADKPVKPVRLLVKPQTSPAKKQKTTKPNINSTLVMGRANLYKKSTKAAEESSRNNSLSTTGGSKESVNFKINAKSPKKAANSDLLTGKYENKNMKKISRAKQTKKTEEPFTENFPSTRRGGKRSVKSATKSPKKERSKQPRKNEKKKMDKRSRASNKKAKESHRRTSTGTRPYRKKVKSVPTRTKIDVPAEPSFQEPPFQEVPIQELPVKVLGLQKSSNRTIIVLDGAIPDRYKMLSSVGLVHQSQKSTNAVGASEPIDKEKGAPVSNGGDNVSANMPSEKGENTTLHTFLNQPLLKSKSKGRPLQHKESVHSTTVSAGTLTKYVCCHCKTEFVSFGTCKLHMKTVHNRIAIKPDIETEGQGESSKTYIYSEKGDRDGVRLFVCSFCPIQFISVEECQAHMANIHAQVMRQPWKVRGRKRPHPSQNQQESEAAKKQGVLPHQWRFSSESKSVHGILQFCESLLQDLQSSRNSSKPEVSTYQEASQKMTIMTVEGNVNKVKPGHVVKLTEPSVSANAFQCSICMEPFVTLRECKEHIESSHPISEEARGEIEQLKEKKRIKKRNRKKVMQEEYGNGNFESFDSEYTGKRRNFCKKMECGTGEAKCVDCARYTKEGLTEMQYKIVMAEIIKKKDWLRDRECGRQVSEPFYIQNFFECLFCGEAYRFHRHYRRHLKRHTEMVCPMCKVNFASINGLFSHAFVHNCGPLKCEECGQTRHSSRRMITHLLSHENLYECEQCGKIFGKEDFLLMHKQRIHSGVKSHKCQRCSYSSCSKVDLADHVASVHENRRHTCPTCNRSYSTSAALRKHLPVHEKNKFVCQECSCWFVQEFQLKLHKMRVHTAGGNQPQRRAPWRSPKGLRSPRVYACPFCGEILYKRAAWKFHIAEHKKFGCNQCHLKFASERSLRKHSVEHKKLSLMHGCHMCGRVFPTAEGMMQHVCSGQAGSGMPQVASQAK